MKEYHTSSKLYWQKRHVNILARSGLLIAKLYWV